MPTTVIYPVLAVDVGLKRSGTAWAGGSDVIEPLEVIKTSKVKVLADRVGLLIDRLNIKQLVIGSPDSGPVVERANQLALTLKLKYRNLKVKIVPETLSSIKAWQTMTQAGLSFKQRKDYHDAYSAVEIIKSLV